jgi:16S rRNA (guanine1516-N2)-methyltransferase
MTGLPLEEPGDRWDALLVDTGTRLELRPQGKDASGPIAVDFGSPAMRRRRRGGHNEALGRAVGVGKWPSLTVVDATAGLGRDSFVLADLGCRVSMVERSRVVCALLGDGLERALASDDAWLREVASRLSLACIDAVEWLAQTPGDPVDVIYLDPMFPERRKSARVKKDMWIFQQLLDDSESAPLLVPALSRVQRRVVVKRPAKAPNLENRRPAFVIPGKTVRFDVYLPA